MKTYLAVMAKTLLLLKAVIMTNTKLNFFQTGLKSQIQNTTKWTWMHRICQSLL